MKKRAGKRTRFWALIIALVMTLMASGLKIAKAEEEKPIYFHTINPNDQYDWYIESLNRGRPESIGRLQQFHNVGVGAIDIFCRLNGPYDPLPPLPLDKELQFFCMEPSVQYSEKDTEIKFPYQEKTKEVFEILKSHYGIEEEDLQKMGRASTYFERFHYPMTFEQIGVWNYMKDFRQATNITHPKSPEESLTDLREKNDNIKEADNQVHSGNISFYKGLAEAELMAMRMETSAEAPLMEVEEPGTYSFDPVFAYAVPEMRAETEEGSPLMLDEALVQPLDRESSAVDTGEYTLSFTIPEEAKSGVYEVKVIRPDYAGQYQWKFFASFKTPTSPIQESCQLFGKMEGQPGEKEEIFQVKLNRPEEEDLEPDPPEKDPPSANPSEKKGDQISQNHAQSQSSGNPSTNKNESSYSTNIHIHYPVQKDKSLPGEEKRSFKKGEKEKEGKVKTGEGEEKAKEESKKKKEEKKEKKKTEEDCYCRDPEKRKNPKDPCPCTDPDCTYCQQGCLKEEEEEKEKNRTLAGEKGEINSDQKKKEKVLSSKPLASSSKRTRKNANGESLFSPQTGAFQLLSLPFIGGALMSGASGLFFLKKKNSRNRAKRKRRG